MVAELDNGPSIAEVARRIGIDRSAASRRVRQALEAGYLRDDDERKSRTRLVGGDPLPEEEEILPSVARLAGPCNRAVRTEGLANTHPPDDLVPSLEEIEGR